MEYLRQLTNSASTALIMWDFQLGLAGRATDLERLVATSRLLLEAADAEDIPVIWSRHTLPPPELSTPGMQYFMMQKQRASTIADLEPFMQVGSPEREFLSELQPRARDTVIDKSTPSFFVATALEQRLFSMGIRTIVFTGVATEVGVDLSAKHALALGYVPVVVEDAVGTYTLDKQRVGLAALRTWLPVVTAEEIIGLWNEQRDCEAT